MRIRTIKPEWLDDERIVCASPEARVLTIALILLADDHGRGRASPLILAGRVFPASENPRETLANALGELASLSFVVLYDVDGQSYFSIRNWDKHQKVDKPGKAQIPSPPCNRPKNEGRKVEAENVRESLAKVPESLATDQDQDQDQEGTGSSTRMRASAAASAPVERMIRAHTPPAELDRLAERIVSETRVAAGGAKFSPTGHTDRDTVALLATWAAAQADPEREMRRALAAFWVAKGNGARLSWLTEEDPGRFLGQPAKARASPRRGMAPPASHEEHAREIRERGGTNGIAVSTEF